MPINQIKKDGKVIVTTGTKKELAAVTVITIIASIVAAWCTAWVLKANGIYSTGITGIAQLIADTVYRFTGVQFNFGVITFIINIPLIVLAYKKLSHRFAYLTTVSLVTQSLFYLLPVQEFMHVEIIAAAIFGGLVAGITSGLILKHGGSPGGLDIIAQYVSLYRSISISKIFYIVNFTIVGFVALLNDIDVAVYTFLRTIITTLALDQIHTSYKYLEVTVNMKNVSCHAKDINEFMGRGGSIYAAKGAYTGDDREILTMVISAYELAKLIKIVKYFDDAAFITSKPVKLESGRFNRRAIQ